MAAKIQEDSLQDFMTEALILQNRNILTDFTLKCEGSVFQVYRVVLAASSPYFRDLFTQQQNLFSINLLFKPVMIVDFMKSEVLQIFVDYFYTRRILIKGQQTPELLLDLFENSLKLEIPFISNYCLEQLLDRWNWSNTEEVNRETEYQTSFTNIIKKFPSFKNIFLKCIFNQVYTLLFDLEIEDKNQIKILQCVLGWVNYDSNNRKQHLTRFLEKVDFDQINLQALLIFKNESLLTENSVFLSACRQWMFKQAEKDFEVILKALDIAHEENRTEKALTFELHRDGSKQKYVICEVTNNNPNKQVFEYNCDTEAIKRMATPQVKPPCHYILLYLVIIMQYILMINLIITDCKESEWRLIGETVSEN